LDDALGPDADDHEVAATLRRLGSPADLAAEAGATSGSSGPQFTLSSWRLAEAIAAIAIIAIIAIIGALQISSDAGNEVTFGRHQHLAQLNAAVVKFTQNLEDERDLSAAYVAHREARPVPVTLTDARTATSAAARTVQADAAGVGTGYQPGTVQDLKSLLASINSLGEIRTAMSSRASSASQIIQAYTSNILYTANTFSASAGAGADDSNLQANVTTLASLLLVENEMSLQRAVLFAALSSPAKTFGPTDVATLEQASESQQADEAEFNASTSQAEQEYFSNTTSGSPESAAAFQETLAEQIAAQNPAASLIVHNTGLNAQSWYVNQSATIDGTRTVADGLVASITSRASTLRSQATQTLLITSLVTLLMLMLVLVLLLSSLSARPLRKPRPGTLDAMTR
jgi:hypothetical protein